MRRKEKLILEIPEVNIKVYLDETNALILKAGWRTINICYGLNSLIEEIKKQYVLHKLGETETFNNLQDFLNFIKEKYREIDKIIENTKREE